MSAWPKDVIAFVESADTFRGLWFSKVSGETRWTVTFRRTEDGEIVETRYYREPVNALRAAMSGQLYEGEG